MQKRGTWLVRQVERRFSREVPALTPFYAISRKNGKNGKNANDKSGNATSGAGKNLMNSQAHSNSNGPGLALRDGSRVVVIGGGIAGSAFTRMLLWLTAKEGLNVEVVLVNSTSCNYCGGLVTDLSMGTLEVLYGLGIPRDLILSHIDNCVYVNAEGSESVEVNFPLVSVLRTSRFGYQGFDDSFKERVLLGMEDQASRLRMVEPTIVTDVTPISPPGPGRFRITLSRRVKDGLERETLDVDLVVMATGLKSLNTPMFRKFKEITGYKDPPVMDASVTEVDTSRAAYNRLEHQILLVDRIIPHCTVALIPKAKNWLTVTSLEKVLTVEDVEKVFAHPVIKEYIDLAEPTKSLRCGRICRATVFTGHAENLCGDGWVVLGDLTGYGRVLKDGYFAALYGARLAAATAVYNGISGKDFERRYCRPIRRIARDNQVGMFLFRLNSRLSVRRWFRRWLLASIKNEKQENPYGGPVHSAFRALTTGVLSYKWITGLFVVGLAGNLARWPWTGRPGRAGWTGSKDDIHMEEGRK